MSFKTYKTVSKSEAAARKYVLGFCFKNQQRFCPFCGSRKFWKLADGRRRCQRCKKAYHDLTNRWWSGTQLSMETWLHVVKLFALELSARKISRELGISYPTIHRACMIIRLAIFFGNADAQAIMTSGEIELDESYFGGKRKGKRGRGAAGKVPVFGILTRGGRVYVEVVPNVTAATLIGITEKVVRKGSIIYTDKYRSYDTLMCCGYSHMRVDHSKYYVRGRVHVNGLEGFWSWAKERLFKHHGISPWWFPLYLKELEFRYNHRGEDLFPLFVERMSALIPALPGGSSDSLASGSQRE